ncbi:MAG TPA: alpha/beta hydrolase [Ohtaekwangia sp.]|uniref:alpha/beta fold hydrolase n=1 Tax=Ohtaekwangia sp. TaxID=2066019 RepID=UPI002F91E93F
MVKIITASFFFLSVYIAYGQPSAQEPLGLALENYPYPFPVYYFKRNIQQQSVAMAYMDVKPSNPNGKTVMLLHGKNFFGAYWEQTIRVLAAQGYRVVIPDQPGFGKSSKPTVVYSFQMLAEYTHALLDSLKIPTVTVVGHSMGGMLAVRFTLMYPKQTRQLVLENPIGLEDYKVYIPYSSIEQEYRKELNKTEAGIRNYHKAYYAVWKDKYEKYVQVQYRWMLNAEYTRLAWVNALTSHMIYTQPVVYELPNIQVPVLLIIGQSDRTVVGKDAVPDSLKNVLGQYPALGKAAAKAIPGARLIELKNVGHIPHLEDTEKFNQALKEFIGQ